MLTSTYLYVTQVYNDIGETTGKLDLEVVDCPTSPKDLAVDNISEDSVSLSWNVPDDDGGSPITGYLVEKRDANRYISTCVVCLKTHTSL